MKSLGKKQPGGMIKNIIKGVGKAIKSESNVAKKYGERGQYARLKDMKKSEAARSRHGIYDNSADKKAADNLKLKLTGATAGALGYAAYKNRTSTSPNKPVTKKTGGSTSKNPGLAKLPTAVRNKMGYQKQGGSIKSKKKK